MISYADYYYEQLYGCYPHESEIPYQKTEGLISYMVENGLNQERFVYHIHTGMIKPNKEGYLKVSDIPFFWNGLVERDTFYYHPALQIRSKAPRFNPETGKTISEPFYLEMRASYTEEDVLRYIRNTLNLPVALYDNKRDSGSVNYLLEKYKNVGLVKPVDFVLYLTDEAKQLERRILSILDITQAESLAYTRLERMIPELTLKKANRIIWRTENI